MAITNTGAVERTITGVNESDLFLDESSSSVNNTGVVERDIEGKHDANFVRPIGDEIFDTQELTPSSGWTIGDNRIDVDTTIGTGNLNQLNSLVIGREYIMSLDSELSVGRIKFQSDANGVFIFSNNIRDYKFTASSTSISFRRFDSLTQGYIENISVKEVLVNRESAVTNTGAVEREVEDSHDANFVHPLGDELIVNGDFSTNSGWSEGTGWGISGEVANQDGSNGILRRNNIIPINTKAKVAFDLTNYGGSGVLSVKFAPNTYPITLTGNGSYTVFTDGTNSINGSLQIITSGGFVGSIDNVSVKEVLVNRESSVTNTGVVERTITGVN